MIHLSLGAYRGLGHEEAVRQSQKVTIKDPVLGFIGTNILQLCPQGRDALTQETCERLVETYPHLKFRPHANIRVDDKLKMVDAVSILSDDDYVAKVGVACKTLKADGYIMHPGLKVSGSLSQVIEACKELSDRYGIAVGVEGMYPALRLKYHLSTWGEYQILLGAGVHFCIDLSHLNILKNSTGFVPLSLVRELLNHPLCLEVHVSGNDGRSDQHRPLEESVWWLPLMKDVNPNALVFYEGYQAVAS